MGGKWEKIFKGIFIPADLYLKKITFAYLTLLKIGKKDPQ